MSHCWFLIRVRTNIIHELSAATKKCGGVISVSNHVFFDSNSCGFEKLTYCQMLDVLPLRLQQQKHAKTPATTAKQLNRMKVKPKYDNTPHSHPGNSFVEASNMGGLMVGIASLAICEFLTKKGDALVTVSFQLSWMGITSCYYKQKDLLFLKQFQHFVY